MQLAAAVAECEQLPRDAFDERHETIVQSAETELNTGSCISIEEGEPISKKKENEPMQFYGFSRKVGLLIDIPIALELDIKFHIPLLN